MTAEFDVCVIGSGAGGAPVAYAAAEAGRSVVVLEKGPWLREADFAKDEIAHCRRRAFTPSLEDEPQVVELGSRRDGWTPWPTPETGWDFWNGNIVGGATNLMSGFFLRLKPDDFRLRSTFGPIEGADVVDWPIGYDDLEPWYTKVEREVGVSGRVVEHPFAEPRSTPTFPFEPTLEHPFGAWLDETCGDMGLHSVPLPRAILSRGFRGRRSCEYAGYCGSYGCTSGAKGSARAALLDPAVATGRCEVRPEAMVRRLVSDASGRVVEAHYNDAGGALRRVSAKVFVVACQAIESSRLLLMSPGPKHPHGLGNNRGQVGKRLIWSTAGWGQGAFDLASLPEARAQALQSPMPFVNRCVQDWYAYEDPESGRRIKGGVVDFLLPHPNPIANAIWLSRHNGERVWGWDLKERLEQHYTTQRHLMFEVFADWLPTDDCFVTLDPRVRDKWGLPVARVRVGLHRHNKRVARHLAQRGLEVLERMGAGGVRWHVSGKPATNLVAGGCRFGADPETSVLDASCRAHDVDNLYVTDGSFMPTGGSVPYTWTIYANAFRVAEGIIARLG